MSSQLLYLEKKLEKALVMYEQSDQFELALEQYQIVESEIKKLEETEVEFTEAHKLLAQCYLRQAGMLRQLGRVEEANETNKKEVESARLSGDSIVYAQSLFSTGINLLSSRKIEDGLSLLNEAKKSFEAGNTDECLQGVGWYWIIMADLGNKGIVKTSNEEIINYANKAISILTPIQNTPGISRAYQARALAYKNNGDLEKADADLKLSLTQ
jgi:tetratricopeptide (TPR) repeat protein